jgi:phosphoribosylanthranilate isomerase
MPVIPVISVSEAMFKIKICGVRTSEDLRAVSQAGGDAVGLNFFPRSVRYLPPNTQHTRQISAEAGKLSLTRVGVVVNITRPDIEQLLQTIPLDAIQLHGDELPSEAPHWKTLGVPLIRAIKLPTGEISASKIDELCQPWLDNGFHPLFDADAGTSHGGVGKQIDWESINKWRELNPDQTFTLAGGLTPKNVSEAINISGTQSVDTASGVEEPRGTKNSALIREFVRNCSLPR